jgi:hypothetical protein
LGKAVEIEFLTCSRQLASPSSRSPAHGPSLLRP